MTTGTAPAAASSTPAAGERAVPYHCPFCAGEDLRPHGSTHGAWHCRSCLRAFSVRFLGLEALTSSATADPTGPGPAHDAPTPQPTPSPTPPPTSGSVVDPDPTGGHR